MNVVVGSVVQSIAEPSKWGRVRDIWLATGALTIVADAQAVEAGCPALFNIHVSEVQEYVGKTA
jgi:hypothetical protein